MIKINLVAAIILFNVLILVYQIIIEIFSILYRLDGVEFDKAKFQVISILTSTGFTTSESEQMLSTPKRRKRAQNMMLFSYIFNISIVSTIVNLLASTSNTTPEEIKMCIGLVILNLLFMFIIGTFQPARKAIDWITVKIANRKYGSNQNNITVIDSYGNSVIAEVEVKHLKDYMINNSIKEFGLGSNYNVQLLTIKRRNQIISEITPDAVIKPKDILIVFGKFEDIKNVFLVHHKVTSKIN